MPGYSGEAIGLGTSNVNAIGGVAQVKADGKTSSRGGIQNFIGFAFSATSQEPLPQDFSPNFNTVTSGRTGTTVVQEPTYSTTGVVLAGTSNLVWATKTAQTGPQTKSVAPADGKADFDPTVVRDTVQPVLAVQPTKSVP